ncbi:regulatory protein, FmdB family [Desulfotomaculum nigrificans CO-1-SRB]|uniref:Regulatory protein, FmdB family n=1 Tax=Desulfotomaculum nigrificans (strain DSM 14880 / VKM B-2319 / CO-1-SRB) TaxID=868595 RepID=F6B956_DESCC|nr:zinc ribbon domain-containing protein [Desulfotomaculum nigrificans]AEF94828.1 regulatory protein, FmdB family [Desulfotomaculum nigrificans CO-1-SRB]
MPIFEFSCKACGHVFEKLQLAGREDEIKCPKCGHTDVEKKISAPFLPSSVGRPADSASTGAPKSDSGSSGGCNSGG